MKLITRIFAALVLLSVGAVMLLGALLATWHQVRTVPVIEDSSLFTATFDPAGQVATTVGTGKAVSLIGDVVTDFRSPFFPYMPLALTKHFPEERCPVAYTSLYEDALWHVAWVRVGWCKDTDRRSELFGPYRATKVHD